MKPLSPSEIETIRVAEPKHDPFSLEALVAWLEKQPGSEAYDFNCWDRCMLGQWLRDIDPLARSAPDEGSGFFYQAAGHHVNLHQFKDIAYGNGGSSTFSAALTRARAALDEQRAGR